MKPYKVNKFTLFIEWLIIPPFFYKDKRKEGMTRGKCLLLTMLSPVFLCIYFLVGLSLYIFVEFPVFYKNVKYKTHADICALTDIPDFPNFEHVRSSCRKANGFTKSTFTFHDTLTVEQRDLLTKKCTELDNIYWTQAEDTLEWRCIRGWNIESGEQKSRPQGIEEPKGLVSIYIRADGFDVYHRDNDNTFLTVNEICTIDLPAYDIVNQTYFDDLTYVEEKTTIRFKEAPDSAFYRGWDYDAKSDVYTYTICTSSDTCSIDRAIVTRRGSRIATISHSYWWGP